MISERTLLWRRFIGFWLEFSNSKMNVVALVFIAALSVLTGFSSFLPLPNPNSPAILQSLQPPSFSHPFGTDFLGRDVLSRFIYGAAIPLTVGVLAGALMTALGVGVGLIAGYSGGMVDDVLMRFTDLFLVIPALPLLLTVAVIFGSSLPTIVLIIAILSWPPLARIIRAETLSISKRDFVLSAKAVGASRMRIILLHVLPNEMSPVLVYLSLGIAGAILTDSALDFLGLAPVNLSWGFDLSTAQSYWISGAWWLIVFPGLGIALTCLSFFIISDGLNSALNPRKGHTA
jgi:peptide/nickel transport system permease protein